MTYEERWEDTVLERGWAAVRQQVGVILAVFGFTSAAQMTVLWGAQRLILARMLRPIEALVRRLVLVMALRWEKRMEQHLEEKVASWVAEAARVPNRWKRRTHRTTRRRSTM